MTYSAALPYDIHFQAIKHLLRSDHQEDLCFALWYPSHGRERTTALIHEIILPQPGERFLHGNASFSPEYFERAIGLAIAANAGLAFLHSHVGPGWQGMSKDDILAEEGHSAATKGATGLPLVGMTLGTDESWSARFWVKTAPREYERQWCSNVRVIGKQLALTYADVIIPKLQIKIEQTRTVSAWGAKIQEKIARLHVGVVGAGSVGSIVAEALARMGIAHISLFDYDSIERINLDRLLHATQRDIRLHRSKVESLSHYLKQSATADPFSIKTYENSIIEENGFRGALDCDILFSCVDRNWPRSVLNFIAYAHLIPVVDGGIRLEINQKGIGIKRGDMRAHVSGPGHKCLECLGQYDPGLVPVERDGYADDPRYIEGLPLNHPFKTHQNVFVFSLETAGLEVMQMLSMLASPSGLAVPGAQLYHFIPGCLDSDFSDCQPNCFYQTLIARGDRSSINVVGQDQSAEKARAERIKYRRKIILQFLNWLDKKCLELLQR